MNLTLWRHAYLPDCTLGWLIGDGLRLATLSEPWIPDPDGPGGQRREPGHQESCVPDGSYQLLWHDSAHHPDTYVLVNEALGIYESQIPPGQLYGRTSILFHNGNTTKDTEGCILVGLRFGSLSGLPAVLDSVNALGQLRHVLNRGDHTLTIRPTLGTANEG